MIIWRWLVEFSITRYNKQQLENTTGYKCMLVQFEDYPIMKFIAELQFINNVACFVFISAD